MKKTEGVSLKTYSNLLSKENEDFLISFLLPRKFSLVFRASEHNFQSAIFHKKCDDLGPTIVVIRANQRTFGGFNSQSWTEKFKNNNNNSG
jgi:hypothetical protein